ncbi:bifunctional riboflavin kinase/FAD synthetase [Jatrophihabitans endophyticus]|uniref:bifunctional riboflavin kinase/FAD synthetase n=1 Tax=Jatrophihabitans endophyticus TaxID=1206085 RepID=UPI0019F96CDE|nr:bifunctional riboflavin kinase/FAD synthetase [Jatrophihabitans endophyticus]MBE7188566.1 bifunctional riboflavin kinase/FAD synthetase [Jatrophihabitans endophyticus]
MERWHGLQAVPTGWGHCVVTIGVFDGIHRGHQSIIAETVALARAQGVPSVLITFVPHPSEVVRPGSHPPQLTTIVRRAELVESLGVDVFCALPFTLELSKMPPDEFVHSMLVDRLHTSAVIVGENFRFGHRAEGDVELLRRLGRTFGFSAQGATLLAAGETPLSATYVRSCVQAGDMDTAADVLGRPHRVDGVVERGDQRGRVLGYPTANLRAADWAAVPADGVYAGRVVALDEWGRTVDAPPLGVAAISVGTNPTFDTRTRRVEAYVLDFDADLYGAGIGVEFVHRLRGMVRFDSVEALVGQMELDTQQTRELMG